MTEGAVIDKVSRESDRAPQHLQVLAAEIRAHEQSVRDRTPSRSRATARSRSKGGGTPWA
jgi:hypothetical protein